MFKKAFIGNNYYMKKLFYLPFLLVYFCLIFSNEYCFLDSLKGLDLAEYKAFYGDEYELSNFDNCLLSGNVKIYSLYGDNIGQNKLEKRALCEQVSMQKDDIKNYIKVNSLSFIKREKIDDLTIEYYYCKKLFKKSYCFGSVYNIVIATSDKKAIIGYPCIMGSL